MSEGGLLREQKSDVVQVPGGGRNEARNPPGSCEPLSPFTLHHPACFTTVPSLPGTHHPTGHSGLPPGLPALSSSPPLSACRVTNSTA